MIWNNLIVGSNELHRIVKYHLNVPDAISTFVKADPPTNIITDDTILTQYSSNQGLEVFGKKDESVVQKKLH